MSKEDVLSLFVYVGMLAIAFVVGFCVLYPADGLGSISAFASNRGLLILFVLISLILGIILNGLFVELGHVVGSIIGGYSVVSFNIFGFYFYKTKIEGRYKWKFKFPKTPDGLTGETIVIPKKQKANPMISILIPLVVFALEGAAMYMVMYFISSSGNKQASDLLKMVKFAVIIIATIGLMFALYNYFPAHIDSTTDGYRLVLFSKKINIEAYNEYLKITNRELLDESENCGYAVIHEITDYTAQLNMLSVYKAIKEKDYVKANELLDEILANKKLISKNSYAIYTTQKFFLEFLSSIESNTFDKDAFKEKLKNIDDYTKTFIYKGNTLQSLKMYLLIENKIECSKSEVKATIEKYKKVYKKSASLNKNDEKLLFNLALTNCGLENI